VTWGRYYWTAFLAASLVGFLVPEVWALCTNWRNTLSAWVWQLLAVQRGEPITSWTWLHVLGLGMYVLINGWLVGHFFFRVWVGRA
jgi:hypothetical protein